MQDRKVFQELQVSKDSQVHLELHIMVGLRLIIQTIQTAVDLVVDKPSTLHMETLLLVSTF